MHIQYLKQQDSDHTDLYDYNLLMQNWPGFHLQKNLSRQAQFFIVQKGTRTLAQALYIILPLPFGKTYIYLPSGPVFQPADQQSFTLIMEELRRIAKIHNSIYIRIEPYFLDREPVSTSSPEISSTEASHLFPPASRQFFLESGFRPAHATPRLDDTLVLDLTQTTKKLLADMKQKTRYNIRLAQKKNLEIRPILPDSLDLIDFYHILQETALRNKFFIHNQSFYRTFLTSLDKHAVLFGAFYQKELVAGLLMTIHHDLATYMYGASSHTHRQLMAPYLLQWHAINYARDHQAKIYDFLGIAPLGQNKNRFTNVGRFKEGFGGERLRFVGTFEYVLQPKWYRTLLTTKKIQKITTHSLKFATIKRRYRKHTT